MLTPSGTTYEIAYEDIINGDTTNGATGGSNTEDGQGSSEENQGKVEVSKEEFDTMKENLKALENRLQAIDGGKQASFTLDTLNKKIPVFHKINKSEVFSGGSTELKYSGLSCTIPKNCYASLTLRAFSGGVSPKILSFRGSENGNDVYANNDALGGRLL